MHSNSSGGYTRVASGQACKRVTSKAECEDAARQLVLTDNVAEGETESNYPPACYFNGGNLWFNTDDSSTAQCSSDNVCICKKTSGKMGCK